MDHGRETRIGILVYEGVDLLDVAVPYELFHWAAIDDPTLSVRLVSAKPGRVTTRDEFRFEADEDIQCLHQFDVVWVPGADPKFLAEAMKDQTVLDFLREQSRGAQLITSVCEGALILAAAGLLDGYEATTHWAFLPCFARFPKIRVAPGYPRFIVDRDRVTGGGISSGLDEALKIIALLRGDDAARRVQLTVQYHPQPPFDSGDPAQAGRPPATSCPVSF